MTPALASLAGVLVFVVGTVIRSLSRMRMTGDRQVRVVLKVAQQVGLAVENAEIGDRIADRLRRQARFALFAIPAWVAVGVLVAVVMPADVPPLLAFVPMWAAYAGQQSAESVAGVVEGFRIAPDRPRVATARLRTRADYADPFVRIGVRVLVAVSASSTAIAIGAGTPSRVGPALAALTAIAALIAADVLAGSLARRRQYAATRDDLVWDDALRALAINTLYGAPFLLTVYPLLAFGYLLSDAPGLPDWVELGGSLIALVTAVTVFVFSIALLVRRPAERVTRRLAVEDAAEFPA